MANRYNFPADELQRRAALSSDLKKKSLAVRATSESAGPKTAAAGADKKSAAAEVPKIDFAALRRASRDRRNFMVGTAAVSGAFAVTLGGSNRFSFPRVLFEPPSTFDAGRIDDFLPNNPTFFKDYRTWMIRFPDRIIALSGRCTHLGCTPSWLSSDTKFKCPCHGSGFRITGLNFEGPAPRALERFKIELVNGQLLVDKSKLFLLEKGDWEKPESFVLV